MKAKLFALFLVLTLVCWGQTSNPPAGPDVSAPATKCACCAKMATDAGTGHKACCHTKQAKGRAAAAVCCSSDSKSCCGDKAQCANPAGTSASCCSGRNQCGAKDKTCCGVKMQAAKMECCGKQCGAQAPDPMEMHD